MDNNNEWIIELMKKAEAASATVLDLANTIPKDLNLDEISEAEINKIKESVRFIDSQNLGKSLSDLNNLRNNLADKITNFGNGN